MIKVGNKRKGDVGEYIARPSPLGNPFYMSSEAERDSVCDRYEAWLDRKIAENDVLVMSELSRLMAIHQKTGELTLVCWCAPRRCHGDVIKAVLEQMDVDNG